MARESYDIVAVGDAIVDVLARRSDRFLDERGVVKGTMRLLGDAEADALVAAMHASGPVDEVPGGSAANTLAGAAAAAGRPPPPAARRHRPGAAPARAGAIPACRCAA